MFVRTIITIIRTLHSNWPDLSASSSFSFTLSLKAFKLINKKHPKTKNQHYRKIEKEKCHLKVKTLIYTTINFDKYSIH